MSDEPKTPLGEKLLAVRNRAITNGMQLKTREEIMNEAPTPEEVEKSLSDVACEVADYSDCEVLRAHIAALSKTIKCQQVDLAGLRKLDFRVTELKEQINLMTKHQAGADEKLCQLEAENKRLAAELDFTAHRMKHEADERDKADEQNKRLVAWLKRAEKELEKVELIEMTGRMTGAELKRHANLALLAVQAALAQTGEK